MPDFIRSYYNVQYAAAMSCLWNVSTVCSSNVMSLESQLLYAAAMSCLWNVSDCMQQQCHVFEMSVTVCSSNVMSLECQLLYAAAMSCLWNVSYCMQQQCHFFGMLITVCSSNVMFLECQLLYAAAMGNFVMVPPNLAYLHCLQYSFFKHYFILYWLILV